MCQFSWKIFVSVEVTKKSKEKECLLFTFEVHVIYL